MKKMIPLLLAAVLLLCGCRQVPVPTTTAAATTLPPPTTMEVTVPVTTVVIPTTTETPAPVYVYEGAVEDYLLPLADNSWPREYAPEFVMLHFTSAVAVQPQDPYDLEAVRKIFTDYGTSIHYLLDREGTVYCYIPEDLVAWHAGKGTFAGDEKYTNKMNYYAIGIEILAIGSQADMSLYLTAEQYDALDDRLLGYTDEQYEALKLLVADICRRNSIPMDKAHVLGHQEYASGKNDPGELFDWERFFSSGT